MDLGSSSSRSGRSSNGGGSRRRSSNSGSSAWCSLYAHPLTRPVTIPNERLRRSNTDIDADYRLDFHAGSPGACVAANAAMDDSTADDLSAGPTSGGSGSNSDTGTGTRTASSGIDSDMDSDADASLAKALGTLGSPTAAFIGALTGSSATTTHKRSRRRRRRGADISVSISIPRPHGTPVNSPEEQTLLMPALTLDPVDDVLLRRVRAASAARAHKTLPPSRSAMASRSSIDHRRTMAIAQLLASSSSPLLASSLDVFQEAVGANDVWLVRDVMSRSPLCASLPDAKGRTALHLAACKGHVAVLEAMLEHKPDVSVRDTNGNSPLHLAVISNHPECALILLRAGAHPLTVDNYGRSPLDLVQSRLRILSSRRHSPHHISAGMAAELSSLIEMLHYYIAPSTSSPQGQSNAVHAELLSQKLTHLSTAPLSDEDPMDLISQVMDMVAQLKVSNGNH